MVLYAPLVVFYIRIISHSSSSISVSYSVVVTSVADFLGIPPGAAIIIRIILRKSISAA